MKTATYSKAVQNEINAINEQQTSVTIKKRLNWELIAAVATMIVIMSGFALLSHLGYIREF